MPKQPPVNQDDIDAFQEAAKGATPLSRNKRRIEHTRSKPQPKIRKQKRYEDINIMLDESADLPAVDGNQPICFNRPGIQNKTLRNLRKGQYNIEAILDLHGMTVEKAQHAVDTFIWRCIRDNIRVVLIIHGKGHHGQQPLLKNKLNYWLRNINTVLAFCSAAPFHGSRGALYVFLKQRTEENLA